MLALMAEVRGTRCVSVHTLARHTVGQGSILVPCENLLDLERKIQNKVGWLHSKMKSKHQRVWGIVLRMTTLNKTRKKLSVQSCGKP